MLGVIGGVGSFVLVTVLANRMADPVVVGASALGAAVSAFLVSPRDEPVSIRDLRPSRHWLAVLGGVASFWVAPLLALSQRLTDAPTGTETAFFTTAAWGFAMVVGAVLASRREERAGAWPATLAGATASLVGCAVLLASWERPSSFSPLVRFARQEIVMVLAGAVFAAGVLAIASQAFRHGWAESVRPAVLSAGLVGVAAAFPGMLHDLAMVSRYGRALVVLALFSAMLTHGILGLARSRGLGGSAVVWFLVPPALTALSVLERLTGVRGPDPIRWGPASAGIAVAVAGAAVVWLGFGGARAFPVEESPKKRRGFAFAAIMVAAGSVLAAAMPTMQGEVTASLNEPFHIQWDMYGLETAAGTITAVALLLAASAFFGSRLGLTKQGVAAAVAALVCAAAYPFVLDTPLRTWTDWVPGDIQQVYGTDYARLTFTPADNPVIMALLVVAVLTATASLVIAVRRPKTAPVGLEG